MALPVIPFAVVNLMPAITLHDNTDQRFFRTGNRIGIRPSMSGPLSKTFAVLAASPADEAHEVLAAALVSSDESISRLAALALADRTGMRGQLEVLNRLTQLSPAVLATLRAGSEKFDPALRQMLHGPAEQQQTALTAVTWLRATEQIPQLIQLLQQTGLPAPAPVIDTLRTVVTQLEDEFRNVSVNDADRARIVARRDQALRDLDRALDHFDSLTAQDEIIESILILGPHHHPVVRRVLWHASADCRERAGNLLLTSRHPQVMQHNFESFRDPYPHPKAFEAVIKRADPEFLCELCRTFSQRANSAFEQNLKQIEHLSWLESSDPPLAFIPPPLQPALLGFVHSTKIAKERKAEVQDWLLRHGGPAGRMAAAERAGQQSQGVIREVLVESLDSEDEHIQAWAVTQLRQRAVPETFSLLLQRLNSPSAEVRQAVREELSDFNTERVLAMVSSLDAATGARAGALLRQIDDGAISKLQYELHSAVRARRIRAAQAAVKLGYQHDLWQELITLTDDADTLVRSTAAEVLASVREPAALAALETLAGDQQPRVRDAAHAALISWQRLSSQEFDSQLIGAGSDEL